MAGQIEANLSLLGAYERDNFGDILFLELTRELIHPSKVEISAPLGGQRGYRPAGLEVRPLKETTGGAGTASIWVVGGEIGGTSLQDAYRMAAPDDEYRHYSDSSTSAQRRLLEKVSGRSFYSSPYIPRMSASPTTRQGQFVINSAGLSGLKGLTGLRKDEAWSAVREATFVSVRDRDSSDILGANKVSHTLAPDLVHTLTTLRSDWLGNAAVKPRALIQVKGAVLRNFGTKNFAQLLSASSQLRRYDLALFVAGVARGHDSVELYREVVHEFRQVAPARDIEIIEDLAPMEKAKVIAESSLWVGTSLHGLIISSSYGIPRVGLALKKLQRYAATWAESMPVEVSLGDIDRAVAAALNTREDPGRSRRLADAAMASFDSAKARGLAPSIHATASILRQSNARRLDRRSRSIRSRVATDAVEAIRVWKRR